MELAKWQIKIKKHGLGGTLYLEITMYRLGHARSNIVAFLTEQGNFQNKGI